MLRIPALVRAQFDAIRRALPEVREALRAETDVVAIRPGYDYSDGQDATSAVVVAVNPGTAPVEKNALGCRFGVTFQVIDASVDEQLAAVERNSILAFEPDSGIGPFERLLTDDDAAPFAPPKRGPIKSPIRDACLSSTRTLS